MITCLTLLSTAIYAQEIPIAANQDGSQAPPDPNTSLVVDPLPAVPLIADPNEPVTQLPSPASFYTLRYHPRVTARIFRILNYPYHRQGLDYTSGAVIIASPKSEVAQKNETAINDTESLSAETDPCEVSADPCQLEIVTELESKVDPEELYMAVMQFCGLVHQWRGMNESPGTALEVVYAVELTKLTTPVYNLDPSLAVEVKRTIGRIGKINRQFDITSRMVIGEIVNGQIDQALMLRLGKQLTALTGLLELLSENNDAISVALGAGPLERSAAWPNDSKFIDYSTLLVPTK